MTDYVGADMVGDDDVESALADLGVSGAAPGLPTRIVRPNSAEGRKRQFPCGLSMSAGLADAASDTLTATPDRASLLRALHVQANSVAGALLYGLGITTLLVEGRNARVGTGRIPDYALRTWAQFPMLALSLGVVRANALVSVGVTNDCGAAVDVTGAFLAETTD